MIRYRPQVEKAEKRKNLYTFLSMVYSRDPTIEFLKVITEDGFSEHLKEMGVIFDGIFHDLPKEELLKELSFEYTRLYIGTGDKHIPPYESFYTDTWDIGGEEVTGLIRGESSVVVERVYARYNFKPLPLYKDIPDHLGVELGFMKELIDEEIRAWKDDRRQKALEILKEEERFLKEHLGQWVGSFCERTIEASRLRFYSTLSTLTRDFILSDKDYIPSLIEKVQGGDGCQKRAS